MGGDPGHEFFSEHLAIGDGLTAGEFCVGLWSVFGEAAVAGVVDADDDEGFNFAGFDGGVGVLLNLPGTTRDERGAWIKEVLAVLKVEDGVMTVGVLVVIGWEIEDDVAWIGEVGALELEVKAQAGVRGCEGRIRGNGWRVRGGAREVIEIRELVGARVGMSFEMLLSVVAMRQS